MDILGGLKRMISGTVGIVLGAVGIFACGAFMAFFLSPQAALEWRHIEALPVLDANGYSALGVGDEAAITGTLQDNKTLTEDGLVAYEKSVWNVTEPSADPGTPTKPTGSWETVEIKVPALNVSITGGAVTTQAQTGPTFGGNMHTTIQPGTSTLVASADGKMLPDKSIRIQGFVNADLVTVVGKKASTGELIAGRLFGGDRVQLVDDIRTQAQTLFTIGVGAMLCSPIFLIIGLGGMVFGRRRGILGQGKALLGTFVLSLF